MIEDQSIEGCSTSTTSGYQTFSLVSLDTTVRLAILAETIVLGGLVVVTGRAAVVRATGDTAALSTLVTGLVGVNLALGEFCLKGQSMKMLEGICMIVTYGRCPHDRRADRPGEDRRALWKESVYCMQLKPRRTEFVPVGL